MENFYENRFIPTPENDELSKSSVSEIEFNPRKITIKRGAGKKKRFITFFDSTGIGRVAVNARTNRPYSFKVGSRHEDSVFGIIIATGETGERTPPTLFYDTPEEYENHFRVRISDETKKRWKSKYNAYLAHQRS